MRWRAISSTFLRWIAIFSHNPDDLAKLYRSCRDNGADLAIGSRYVTGVNVVNWPMSRVLLSYYASAYVRFVTRMPVRDATAGFKCYRRNVLRNGGFGPHQIQGLRLPDRDEIRGLETGLQTQGSTHHLYRTPRRHLQNVGQHHPRSRTRRNRHAVTGDVLKDQTKNLIYDFGFTIYDYCAHGYSFVVRCVLGA